MKRLILFLVILCSACNIDEQDTLDPVFCTDEIRAGLEITVKDGADNELVLTTGITVVVRDGSYIETLANFSDSDIFVGAFERTGNYTVKVSGDGYQTYTSEDLITVEKDICHVITEKREIILQPN